MPCPCHGEGHKAIWFLQNNYDYENDIHTSRWECANCHRKKPVGKSPKIKLYNGMTAAQHRTIETLSYKTYQNFIGFKPDPDTETDVEMAIKVCEYFTVFNCKYMLLNKSGVRCLTYAWHIYVFKGGRCESYDEDHTKKINGLDSCIWNVNVY